MKKYPRESFYFATKLPIWMMKDDGPERMEEIFSDQLKRLQTDYIDFYLLHGVDEEGFETVKRLGAYDFIRKKQAEGKVRHVGISFHDTPEVLERFWTPTRSTSSRSSSTIWTGPCRTRSASMNCWRNAASLRRDGAGARRHARQPGQRRRRSLQQARPQDSVASWAIRFVASLPGVLTILSGMTTMDQLTDNLETLSDFEPLSGADRETLGTALGIFRKNGIIPARAAGTAWTVP